MDIVAKHIKPDQYGVRIAKMCIRDSCKAVDCMYNENCNCHAGKISVEGSNACHCEQTECATFQCGCK